MGSIPEVKDCCAVCFYAKYINAVEIMCEMSMHITTMNDTCDMFVMGKEF